MELLALFVKFFEVVGLMLIGFLTFSMVCLCIGIAIKNAKVHMDDSFRWGGGKKDE